jgi:hypothetical protein
MLMDIPRSHLNIGQVDERLEALHVDVYVLGCAIGHVQQHTLATAQLGGTPYDALNKHAGRVL